jgi:hypothetical protein
MKKSLIAFVLIALFSTPLFAQTNIAPTTSSEYLYGAVGYKLQLNNKLAMKEGYTLADFTPVEEANRKVEFKGIYRTGETKPCAFIMIYTKMRNTPQYYCIPTHDADQELWTKFFNSLLDDTENQQPQLQFFAYCLAQLSAQLAARP